MAINETKYRVLREEGFGHRAALRLADTTTDSSGTAVADPAALTSTVVTTADAPVISATFVQAEVAAVAALANEEKADLNALRNDVSALRGTVASLQASLRAAGLLDT